MPNQDSTHTKGSNQNQLQASAVIEWIKSLVSDKKTPQGTKSIEELARFGIQNVSDLLAYLNTTEGKHLKNKILNHLIKIEESRREVANESLIEKLLWHRIKSLLVMICCANTSNASERIKEINEKISEKSLKAAQKSTESSASHKATQTYERAKEVAEIISNYEHAAKDIKTHSQEIQLQHDLLLEMSEQLQAKGEVIDQHYAELHDKIEYYETKLSESGLVDDTRIEAELTRLTQKLQGITNKLSSEELNDESQDLVKKRNKHTLKISLLRDIIQVQREKTKYFTNEQGKQVDSFKDAAFILSNDQRVCEKDGQFFLLQGQDWNLVQENIEEMTLANKRYEEMRPQLLAVKFRIKNEHSIEKSIHQDQQHQNQNCILMNHIERLNLENQSRMIQAAISEIKQLARHEHLTTEHATKPLPTPRPMSGSSISKSPAVVFFKNPSKMVNTRELTPKQLMDYLQNLPGNNAALIRAINPSLRRLSPITPIPASVVQNMIRTLTQFGIDPYRRSPTPKQGPLETAYKPLTPLNMKPKG